MYSKLIGKLTEMFNCKFDIEDRQGMIVIYCNNEKMIENKKTFKEILDISMQFIEEERLWDIAIISDKYRY